MQRTLLRFRALTFQVSVTVLALAVLAAPTLAQPDDVEIRIHPIKDGIYMLEGYGGNLGLSIGEDGAFLIDDQYAPLTDKIRAAIATLTDQPIRFVINTHWHGDHTGGNENMGKAGSLIVAHENVRQRMNSEHFSGFLNRTTPPSPPDALPVVTFNDSVSFHLNGEEIHAFHVPQAHTDGDAIIHFKNANVMHLGDLFFNKMYPFIDLWSGGSVDGFITAVEKVLAMTDDNTKIIPGHGDLASRADLASYLKMLKKTRANVNALIEAGKTFEDIVEAKPNAEFDESWEWGFINVERYLTLLYKGIKKEL